MAVLSFEEKNEEGAKENLLKVHELNPEFNAEKVNLGLAEFYMMQKNHE